jgi:hypothetical protein
MTDSRPRPLAPSGLPVGQRCLPGTEEPVPLPPPRANRRHHRPAPIIRPAKMPFQPADRPLPGRGGRCRATHPAHACDRGPTEPAKQFP